MESNMKKVLCICIIICGANLLNAKDGKYAWEMSYSTPDFSAAYRPNVYVDFQSTAVHTKQLEIQEHILQRLDWLHLNMDKLANKELDKRVFKLVQNTDNIAEGTSNLVKNTDTIEAIGVWIIALLIIIAVILSRILHATNKNNKLLQKCIQS